MSKLSRCDYAYVDFSDSESLFSYAKKLEGHTFRDVLELGITPEGIDEERDDYNVVSYKGGVGNLIEERYFGYREFELTPLLLTGYFPFKQHLRCFSHQAF